MIIRKIPAFERDAVKRFYLDLSGDDRRKRFCSMLSDDAISKYVDGVDFMRHTMLGAFNEHAQLIGLAELAPGAEESELAFSVRPDLRSRGIGTRLMERALLYARVCGTGKVFVMYLSDNTPMSRMARNAGMQAKTAGGETYAGRELAAPSAQELSRWFIDEAIAQGEYFSVLGIERWGRLLTRPMTPGPRDAGDAITA